MFGRALTISPSRLKGDLLGANLSFAFAGQVAMGVDPCLGTGLTSRRIGEDEEGPTGVLAGDLRNELGVRSDRVRILRKDRQIDEGSARLGIPDLVPQFSQFLVDSADLHGKASFDGSLFRGVHRRLQVALKRLINSSASVGPQVPAA